MASGREEAGFALVGSDRSGAGLFQGFGRFAALTYLALKLQVDLHQFAAASAGLAGRLLPMTFEHALSLAFFGFVVKGDGKPWLSIGRKAASTTVLPG